jgi:DNA-binding transcriptional MerR regulator
MGEFYTIRELASELEVPSETVRLWLKEFGRYVVTKKVAGQRQVAATSIPTLRKVKELVVVELYTVEGARRQLERSSLPEVQHDAALQALREEVRDLKHVVSREVQEVKSQIAATSTLEKSSSLVGPSMATISREEIKAKKIRRHESLGQRLRKFMGLN